MTRGGRRTSRNSCPRPERHDGGRVPANGSESIAPMKEVLSAVKARRFHHDGNPVTTWMMSNVTAKLDAKDNIYPRKEKPQIKIDGAVAIIMGMASRDAHEGQRHRRLAK
jgi:phage terminase large subunit-like protein